MDIIDFAEQLNDLIAENRELKYQNSLLMEKVEMYYQMAKDELDTWQNLYGGILDKLVNKG